MNFQYNVSADSPEGLAAMAAYYLATAVFGGGMGLLVYILRSWGLYAISKNRGLKRGWFAWLPVVRNYQLGCIADQYQYVVRGKNTVRRKWLLGLNIVTAVLAAVLLGTGIGTLAQIIALASRGGARVKIVNAAMSALVKLLFLALPLVIAAVPLAVIRFVALYDLYASCQPGNKVLFLLLSILFGKTEAFFIFFLRNRDEGMPPRKAAPAPEEPPVWEMPEEPME